MANVCFIWTNWSLPGVLDWNIYWFWGEMITLIIISAIGSELGNSGFNAIYLPSIPYFLSQNTKNYFTVNKMKHNIEITHYLIYSHYHKYSVASLTQESPITKHRRGWPVKNILTPDRQAPPPPWRPHSSYSNDFLMFILQTKYLPWVLDFPSFVRPLYLKREKPKPKPNQKNQQQPSYSKKIPLFTFCIPLMALLWIQTRPSKSFLFFFHPIYTITHQILAILNLPAISILT